MKTKTILTPYFLDQPLPGLETYIKPDWILNREPMPGYTTLVRMSTLHAALAKYVQDTLQAGFLPVSLAGDCCAAVGVLAGIRRAGINPLLIWFDAHGDFNTWETSPSGFLGGMPLAMIAGLGEQTLLEAMDIEPLPHEQIILTDARDLDPGERELVESSRIMHFKDPKELFEIDLTQRPIWIHFDTDVLDPEDVPAQNYPAPGGIRAGELAEIFKYLADTGLITAVSISSWAPDLDGADLSREVSLDLLSALVGQVDD